MNTTIAWVNIMKEEYRFLGVRMMKNTFADRRMERMMAKWGIRAKFGRRKWNDKRIFWIFTQQEISWLFRTTLTKLTNQYFFFFCERKTAVLDWGSHWQGAPSDYSIHELRIFCPTQTRKFACSKSSVIFYSTLSLFIRSNDKTQFQGNLWTILVSSPIFGVDRAAPTGEVPPVIVSCNSAPSQSTENGNHGF